MADSVSDQIRKDYKELKDWSGLSDKTSRRVYEHQSSSLEDAGDNIPTDERENNNASSDPAAFVVIYGWIYPSSEPFNGKKLPIQIRLAKAYPFLPPTVYMGIQLRHPNIEENGRMCIDLLNPETESEKLSLVKVVEAAVKLMDEPNTDSSVDTETAVLCQKDRLNYNRNITTAVNTQVSR
ncbi:unnamed protein product [Adineta ricciae]|uniref:UBC core domain-containing protein n=1 Tax=Adineta ricciae TaxID=249248 RepID=A0A815GKU8_ADIRI|nr:unnamed protein product [Adineta ricciae]